MLCPTAGSSSCLETRLAAFGTHAPSAKQQISDYCCQLDSDIITYFQSGKLGTKMNSISSVYYGILKPEMHQTSILHSVRRRTTFDAQCSVQMKRICIY